MYGNLGEEAAAMSRVLVIGAVNMDVGGRSYAPLRMADSNPAAVSTSFGGVGRNIALHGNPVLEHLASHHRLRHLHERKMLRAVKRRTRIQSQSQS